MRLVKMETICFSGIFADSCSGSINVINQYVAEIKLQKPCIRYTALSSSHKIILWLYTSSVFKLMSNVFYG